MSVTYAKGFSASAVTAGFKASGKPDLALLIGQPGTTAAGLFTTNRVAAAPVHLSRSRLESGSPRAVLVNSGQANAATGTRGDADAIAATAAAARTLNIDTSELLQCSTGVIGEPLHMEQLLEAIPGLVSGLATDGGETFAHAILTTDTVDKRATADAGSIRVGGCAKGVGMIAPDLATMLVFVTTDANVAAEPLQELAREQLGRRFNELTVDACSSTNDTVLLFASAAAETPPMKPGDKGWPALEEAIASVGRSLARQLIADAEGANHVLVIDVDGADSEHDARLVAKAVADSPLVKAAAFGGDPNPGRILQAVGSSGAQIDPAQIDITIGQISVVSSGVIPATYFARRGPSEAAREQMAKPEILIGIRLGAGQGRSRAFGCDLSYEYVRINGEYTT